MLEQKIQALIEPIVQQLGLELWACEMHSQGHHSLLRIYIDGKEGKGATLDDCTNVSREVSAILDVEDVIKNRYHLEVSTPGIDRTLFTAAHFKKYVGATVKVKLRIAHEGLKHFIGRVENVADDEITFDVDNKPIKIMLNDIQKANVVNEERP